MLVSNEIERPITVNIRPRKSRHGGVSTQIVAKEKAGASTAPRAVRGQEKRPAAPAEAATARKPAPQRKSGGLLSKVLGPRRA